MVALRELHEEDQLCSPHLSGSHREFEGPSNQEPCWQWQVLCSLQMQTHVLQTDTAVNRYYSQQNDSKENIKSSY